MTALSPLDLLLIFGLVFGLLTFGGEWYARRRQRAQALAKFLTAGVDRARAEAFITYSFGGRVP